MDPLQNILHCADMIMRAREAEPGCVGAAIGELDHVCEIQRQMLSVRLTAFSESR